MSKGKVWTEVDDSNMIKWLAEGLSMMRVGQRLNRSVMAVKARKHLLDRWTREARDSEPGPKGYQQAPYKGYRP